ncbi:conjugal transfer protein [Actinopolymorpha pittospori]
MTEPNEPTTPLSRMRFSWQRGQDQPDAVPEDQRSPEAPPDDVALPWDDESGAGEAAPPRNGSDRPAPPSVPDARLTDAGPRDARRGGAQTRPGAGAETADTARVRADLGEWDDGHGARNGHEPPANKQRRSGRGSSKGESAAERRPAEKQTRASRRQVSAANASALRPSARGDFDVPAAGRRFSGGRGAHATLKVGLILTVCLIAVGVVGYMAFALGFSTGRENTYQLSKADIARYRLTNFPLDQAGRFAADYARICLTHDATPGANDQREAQLSRYVSSGTDTRCGWNGEGSQTVSDASWTGESEPIDVPGYTGKSRMMTVRVLTSTGSRVVTVPVYVADLASGNGMRVIGDVGEMPQPTLATVPEAQPPAGVDGRLGDALTQGEFFQQFFEAWGQSNRPALQRFVTPDASTRTISGLGGAVSTPTIQKAEAFLPKGADPSVPYDWKTGMVTQAWVWVSWQTPGVGSKATEVRAYRLQLVKTTQGTSPSQEWAVRDIRGGVPDIQGG